eukprot:scaffold14464_cov88-Skeletonema_menzelii.AAC.1
MSLEKSCKSAWNVMKLDIMLLTSLSLERESGVRVVTSNTKETTIATAATFIDTNGSDSGGGIHRRRYQECQQDYIFDVVDTTCHMTKSAWSLSYYYHLYAE